MSRSHHVALLGFSEFERNTLASYLRLAKHRMPRYELSLDVAGADFLIADAEHAPSVRLVTLTERMDETVFIGPAAPPGATAWMMRPIDPMHVLRELDTMVAAAWAAAPPAQPPGRQTTVIPPRRPEPVPLHQLPVLDLPSLIEPAAAAAAWPPLPTPLTAEDIERLLPPVLRADKTVHAPPSVPVPVPAPDSEAEAQVAAPAETLSTPAGVTMEASTALVAEVPEAPAPVTAALPAEDILLEPPPHAPATEPPVLDQALPDDAVLELPPLPAHAPATSVAPPTATPPVPTPAPGPPPARRRRSREPDPSTPPPRALLVDDSEIALRFLETKLRRYGFQTDRALTSDRAIQMLGQRGYDFVFLDVELGAASELDGLALCQHIRRHQAADQLLTSSVVMVSAHHAEADRVRGTLAGADAYLGKPLSDDELGRLLTRHGLRPSPAAP